MKLKEGYSKLQDLLRETITLLCKSGLDYKASFNVDAVIGITVDGSDGFYVTLKESFQNEKVTNESASNKKAEDSDISDGDCSISEENYRRTKSVNNKTAPKGASRRKRQPEHGYIVNTIEHSASCKKQKLSNDQSDQDDVSNTSSLNFNMQDAIVKCEPTDLDNDLIFVKTEKDQDLLPQQLSDASFQQSNLPTIPTTMTTEDSSLNLQWNTQQIPSMASMRFNSPGSVSQQANPSVCPLCAKVYRYKQGLKDHMRAVHGMGDPYTCECGQTFMWRTTRDQHKKTCQVAMETKNLHGSRSRKSQSKGKIITNDNLVNTSTENNSSSSTLKEGERAKEVDYNPFDDDSPEQEEDIDGNETTGSSDKLKVVVNQILERRRNGQNC